MEIKMKKILCLILMISMICASCAFLVGCSGRSSSDGSCTYRTYTSALGTNWNPHTWEVNADSEILGYLSSPLVGISVKDSDEGIYTWVYEMATSVKDVTENNKDDLEKFKVTLPEGQSPLQTTSGYVFEISLNPDACWENGEKITAEDYIYSMKQLLDPKMKNYRANLYYSEESAIAGALNYYEGKTTDISSVGLYAVDEYTLHYVTQNQIDYNYFLNSCTSNWLVYEPYYEAGKKQVGELTVTDYGTNAKNTMSYGPYKLASIQQSKQAVFEQNPSWYGYENEDGRLISYTNFEVDGEIRRQYQTTKIVIDVMDEQSAKNAFLRGELSTWTPAADELKNYSSSDRLYKNPETYTMSIFFNTNPAVLKKLDTQSNKNSIVISNKNFRNALSLAFDRNEFVSATQNYLPEYTLLNKLYFYDIYNDPSSSYRNSEPAMREICRLYGVEYSREAYNAITGYNPTQAGALMKKACDELVRDGLYTCGEDIVIRIGWAKGALSSDDNKQVSMLNRFVNRCAEGSGFGNIRFEAVGNIENRYSAVPSGEYACGYGAWGGAAFYPFRSLQVYMDPDQYAINEAGCYDPKKDKLEISVDGKPITKTWQEWSRSLSGSGEYASSPLETKLEILSRLESSFLETYYRIPICSTTSCSMLSYQCENYTENYNLMYGFGGLRLMSYNYDDGEWADHVKKNKNDLSYE